MKIRSAARSRPIVKLTPGPVSVVVVGTGFVSVRLAYCHCVLVTLFSTAFKGAPVGVTSTETVMRNRVEFELATGLHSPLVRVNVGPTSSVPTLLGSVSEIENVYVPAGPSAHTFARCWIGAGGVTAICRTIRFGVATSVMVLSPQANVAPDSTPASTVVIQR